MLKAIIKASISFFVMNNEATRRCDEQYVWYVTMTTIEMNNTQGRNFLNMRQDLTIR